MSITESVLPAEASKTEGETDFTRALRAVFEPDFRVCIPVAAFPHHLVIHENKVVVVLAIIEDMLLENALTGSWEGPTLKLDPAVKLAELASDAARIMTLDPEVIVPVLWLVGGLSMQDTSPSSMQVNATSDPSSLRASIEALCVVKGAGLPASDNPAVVGVAVGTMSIEATRARNSRGGQAFTRLIAAISHSLKEEKALGTGELTVMGVSISHGDLVDPAFMLPVLALVAYEDWNMPTRHRTHGTGFTVDIEKDPLAVLGMRITNIQPAVPFVALAPIVSAAKRTRQGDKFVFDDLIKQAIRWAMKNGINPEIFTELRRQMDMGTV